MVEKFWENSVSTRSADQNKMTREMIADFIICTLLERNADAGLAISIPTIKRSGSGFVLLNQLAGCKNHSR
jgi:hypothetical protein